MAENLHSWTTKEFEHREKGTGWYVTAVIIALLFIGYSVYLRDYFAVAFSVIFCGIVIYFAAQKPREMEVIITDQGIKLGNVTFSYNNLRRFWILERPDGAQLNLETTAYLNRFIVIPLGEENPELIAEIISAYIPQTEAERESISQRIARKLRF